MLQRARTLTRPALDLKISTGGSTSAKRETTRRKRPRLRRQKQNEVTALNAALQIEERRKTF